MKKILLAATVLFSLSAAAQKTPVKRTTTTTATPKPFKTLADSASYAIGLQVANFYKQQGFKNLNPTMIAKAINDVQSTGKSQMNEQEANEAIMFYMDPNLRKTIGEGKAFLATNAKRAGVKTTASGIQYEVLKDAQGARPTSAQDTVVVHYAGRLINGTEFDNSYNRGEPTTFPLDRVIRGWTEGLQLIPTGGKYRLYIPYNLGYGMNGNGSIPGGATLIFDVELITVKKVSSSSGGSNVNPAGNN